MLTKKDYQDAIDVLDACNLSGIVLSFAEIMKKMSDEDLDTKRKNRHAICVLFAEKIRELTNCEGNFSEAYTECKTKACL